jgi:DNA-binding XRE family transcriptional regulator
MKIQVIIAEMEVGVGAQNYKNIEYNRQKNKLKTAVQLAQPMILY